VAIHEFEEFTQYISQQMFRQHPHLAMENLVIGNKQHSWDALNVVLYRPLQVFVSIDFGHYQFTVLLFGDFIEDGDNHRSEDIGFKLCIA
jgi:hypothetical protein